MASVLITGGTGLIGTALTKALLLRGHQVIILSRASRESQSPGIRYAHWDVKRQTIDADAVTACDHIIHLAGAGIAEKRWTNARKKEIVESRTMSSRLLCDVLGRVNHRVTTVVSASAIGWYGPDRPELKRPFIESDPAYTDFLGSTCAAWEASIEPVTTLGVRLVKLRTGIVASPHGGALESFKKPLRFGFATILGNGKQVTSWIHLDDLVNMYLFAIGNNSMNGTFNAVAPQPVTNRNMVLELARQIKGKHFVRVGVPSAILKIALGEMSIEVLKSATVSSQKITEAGFRFLFPDFRGACRTVE